jgi:hypothetical protein
VLNLSDNDQCKPDLLKGCLHGRIDHSQSKVASNFLMNPEVLSSSTKSNRVVRVRT